MPGVRDRIASPSSSTLRGAAHEVSGKVLSLTECFPAYFVRGSFGVPESRYGAELPFVELLIRFARSQQIVVLSLADNAPAIHHNDRIGAQNGIEAVGNDEGGAFVQHALNRLLNQVFALGIDLARRLVENQDRRLAIDGPRDAQPLLLPAG